MFSLAIYSSGSKSMGNMARSDSSYHIVLYLLLYSYSLFNYYNVSYMLALDPWLLFCLFFMTIPSSGVVLGGCLCLDEFPFLFSLDLLLLGLLSLLDACMHIL